MVCFIYLINDAVENRITYEILCFTIATAAGGREGRRFRGAGAGWDFNGELIRK